MPILLLILKKEKIMSKENKKNKKIKDCSGKSKVDEKDCNK